MHMSFKKIVFSIKETIFFGITVPVKSDKFLKREMSVFFIFAALTSSCSHVLLIKGNPNIFDAFFAFGHHSYTDCLVCKCLQN